MTMNKKRVQDLLSLFSAMKTQRAVYDEVWRHVSMYEAEEQWRFAGSANSGEMSLLRDPRVLDSTALHALTVFSSGMLSGVSPPSSQWFRISVSDRSGGEEMKKHPSVAAWIEAVERIFLKDFTQKNFYTQQVNSYRHIGLYGMQAMFVGEDSKIGTFYRDIHPDEIYVAENTSGSVDTVFREMSIPLRQVVELFGKKNLSKGLQATIDRKNADMTDKITIVHGVLPKTKGYENILGANRLPFASYYMEPGEEHLISEKGFRSLPYIVTRAYTGGSSPYSFSPGTLCLADVKMTNEIKTLLLRSGQLRMAPPIFAPDGSLVGRINFDPYAINYYRKNAYSTAQDIAPMNIGGDMPTGMELLDRAAKDINTAFFVDLFLLIHNRTQLGKGSPTATEVDQLVQEKSFLLAPILVNQQQENFDRLFDRVFEIKLNRGEIPPLPDELRGIWYEMDYDSPLSRAQMSVQKQSIQQFSLEMAQFAQLHPQVLDILDSDAIARKLADYNGIPMTCIRTPEAVAQLRAVREQQQQALQAAQFGQQALAGAGQMYGQLSAAPQPGSPMEQLMSGGGAQ
jgi:hypothetical protein